ncbi:MAG: uroporphyrinogen decarboxylase family protein [Armatimonadota bacterium]
MTHRERVQTALNHEEPDRVPIDLGSTCVTSIAASTYAGLREHLGLPYKEVGIAEIVQQIARVDEDVMEILGVDFVPVMPAAGLGPVIDEDADGTKSFKDGFGATLSKPAHGFYYDWTDFPLTEPSIEALNLMPWPETEVPALYNGLRDRVLKLRSETDYALVGMAASGHDLFNQLFRARGMANGMMDLLLEEEFVEAFFDRLMHTIMRNQELFLDEVGDLLDVHFTADDLSGQFAPLISPEIYRKMIKPRWARIISLIKSKTDAKIFYHTCGAVNEFIPDLIEIGMDILNPVQVASAGMDSAELKRKYGDKLTFWGGGCDTQNVLPFGTLSDVRLEVERRIRDFAPGGGFVFNPVHNIQPGVPAENIVALFVAAKAYRSCQAGFP